MFLLRGADEPVEGDIEDEIHLLELSGIPRVILHWGDVLAGGGLHHLDAVFIGAGQKEHVLAVEPLKSRQRVGGDGLIGVAAMRNAVRIGDCRRDVIAVAGQIVCIRHCCEGLSSHFKIAVFQDRYISRSLYSRLLYFKTLYFKMSY